MSDISTRPTANRSWLPLTFLWLVVTACNILKPFHMDDTVYLYCARAILNNFFHPYEGMLRWGTLGFAPLSNIAQPVLTFYPLAAIIKIFGESELALHLWQSVYAALAIGCFFRLSKSLQLPHPVTATSLFALSPAFVPSQNLMTDVPLLAFVLLCFLILSEAIKAQENKRLILLSGAALGVACLTKYPAVALFPAYGLGLYFARAYRLTKSYLLSACIPIVLIAGWGMFSYLQTGSIHFINRQFWESGSRFGQNSIDWMICLGSITPFSFMFFFALRKPRNRMLLAAVISATSFFVPSSLLYKADTSDYLNAGARFYLANGLVVVFGLSILVFSSFKSRKQDQFRWQMSLVNVVWIVSGFVFITVVSRFIAVRYLLMLTPPIVLFACSRTITERLPKSLLVLAITTTALLGVALGIADLKFAALYRTIAFQLGQQYHSAPQIWAVGDWGWQWYAQQNGMKIYTINSKLSDGDIVILPSLPIANNLSEKHKRGLDLLQDFNVEADGFSFLRTVSDNPWGGFYSSSKSALPWRISSEPLERFKVYEFMPLPTSNLSGALSIRLSDDENPTVSYEGFHSQDSWGRWASEQQSVIRLDYWLPQKFQFKIRALAYAGNADKPVKIKIGDFESSLTLSASVTEQTIEVSLSSPNVRKIEFQSALPPVSPAEQSLTTDSKSKDIRRLGLGIASIDITPHT